MTFVDPNWPIFLLAGLLVGEQYYAKNLSPRIKELKRRYSLDKTDVLHSRDIRRCEGAFRFLADSPETKSRFYNDLTAVFQTSRIRLYAVAIDKRRLSSRFIVPVNPYNMSLNQLLSLICGPPGTPSVWRPSVSQIVAECRGKVEDKQLQAEYQSLRKFGLWNYGAREIQSRKARTVQRVFPDRVNFVRKSTAVAGLELVDLAAYPIARAVLTNTWDNPAYLAIATKLKSLLTFP